MEVVQKVGQGAWNYWKKLPVAAKVVAASFGALYATREIYLTLTQKDLTDQVVVITGGGSGIGRLLALKLSKQGCVIVLWDVDEKGLNKVTEEVKQAGDKHSLSCRGFRIDITDRKLVHDIAQDVLKDFKRVDILINNAGIVSGKTILENSEELMAKTIAVNATAHLWTIKNFLPGMLERNSGHIVTIASAAGTMGVAGLVDYCASKYAAIGINDSLRAEIYKLGKNIDTLCVCPYYIKTEMFKGVSPYWIPMLEPEYVVNSIVGAMKRRQAYLMLPFIVNISSALVRIFPASVIDFVAHHIGVNSGMDTFQGKH